jgi:energy-converting hydrogenase B subunit D
MVVIAAILLWLAVSFAVVGALGMWLMRDPYQRLHYLTLPCSVSSGLLTLAVLFQGSLRRLDPLCHERRRHPGHRSRHLGQARRTLAADHASAAAGAAPMMGALQCLLLLLAAAAGMQVVRTRDPLLQAISVSFYGLVLSLLFFIYQAPDVALSQIVVGAVALPLMIVLTLVKAKRDQQNRRASQARE